MLTGKIPKDWSILRIKEIAKTEAGGTPSTFKREYWNGNVPWINSGELKNKPVDKPTTYITELALKNSAAKLLPPNTVLIALTGATTGMVGYLTFECSTNQSIVGILPNHDKFVSKYVFYYLAHNRKRVLTLNVGSAQPHINKKVVDEFSIALPPLSEQHEIVEVLSVVDLTIAKTGEVVAKTERLKKGLMQELLTKGIGHKEHKQTPIGKTPKIWEVIKLEDIAEIRGNRSVNDFEKIAFIPMELIPESQIFAKYQIRAKEDVRSFTYCEAGDLLLAKITPSLENGKQGIVPSDVPNGVALATTEVFPICCKEINGFFLFYVLKFSKFRNKIISSMIGTTGRQRASKESVKRLEIPLPPIDEQQKIAKILSNVDKKLELERNEKAKLEKVKRGLMNLLLTGKIRVKVD
jgi:type I restriction enzyme S subunit